MARFLSPEWLAALGAVARDDPALAAASVGAHLVVEQVVGEVRWAWVLDDGAVSVVPGGVADPDVTLTTDTDTAAALVRGELSAQDAFLAGRLRLGGDVIALLRGGEVLAGVGGVADSVRADTTF